MYTLLSKAVKKNEINYNFFVFILATESTPSSTKDWWKKETKKGTMLN